VPIATLDPEQTSTSSSALPSRIVRILVTGGGTGGHTTPAVATIQAIRTQAEREGWSPQFLYLGSRYGVERGIAEDLGVEFAGIETGKLRRSRRLIGLLSIANIRDMLRVPVGYVQALGIVRKFRPDVALSTGGYVSVPGVLASAALGVPVVAHEQTVQVGLANRINFRAASVIALSVDETLNSLPQGLKARAIVTGNPVREVIFGGNALTAARHFELSPESDKLPTIYVTNRAVEDSLAKLLETCRVIHQCGAQPAGGEQDFDRLNAAREALPPALQGRYAVTKFVGPEVGDVYALASLVIGRSGAGTVTELCALGKPAIFVPLVPTGGDEQTRNAQRLANAGAAWIVKQDELTGDTLLAAVQDLMADPARLATMGDAARRLAMPDAAEKLAALVLDPCSTLTSANPKR
jgi:UDP-N-acetylglucosamine--N-acetylmuramyl-(pentapeptide) pyrophosphoryl-undecaprenol N-acetylglucosamine transferase